MVTDLGDPLKSLAIATVALARGADHSTAEWQEEPGSLRWLLRRNGDRLLIRILYFPEMFTNDPDDKGEVVFINECRLVEFVGQVLSELRRILEEHGLEGYQMLSPHGRGFPVAEYEALQQLSRSRKRAARVQHRGQQS